MEAREIASLLRELSQSYEEFGKAMEETAKTTKPLKRLIGKTETENAEGARLIKIGMALIAFPDPPGFPSDIAGVSLVLAGLAKRKMKPITAADVNKNFHDAVKGIKDIERELTSLC